MAWRKVTAGPAPGAVAALLAYERDAAEAAAAGDARAAGRLASARSWLAMLAAAGGDPDIAGLFAEFARADHGVA